jgi:predicted transcriptional regulator
MAKFDKKKEAHILRRKGHSINGIAKELGVSKASVSVWCKDLVLTKKQKEILLKNSIRGGSIGRLKGAQINKEKKEKIIGFYKEEGKSAVGSVSQREKLLVGTALYWAEGSKRTKLSFVNSDPQMILFMCNWFQECLGVKKEDFIVRVSINEIHTPRINKVIKFWSDLLQLPKSQFRKTLYIKVKPKKIYENHDIYYGMLALRIRRSSKLLYRISGLVEAIREQNI